MLAIKERLGRLLTAQELDNNFKILERFMTEIVADFKDIKNFREIGVDKIVDEVKAINSKVSTFQAILTRLQSDFGVTKNKLEDFAARIEGLEKKFSEQNSESL